MANIYYAGFDVHKKSITVVVKDQAGKTIQAKTIRATREGIEGWAKTVPRPFSAVLETTLFTGWVYDELKRHTDRVKAANSMMLSWIAKGKRKSDTIDAEKLADLLRVDLIPEVYMMPEEVRSVRNLLRYRHFLVRECTRFKNKIAGQLMTHGVVYDDRRLHTRRYFGDLVGTLEADKNLVEVLRSSRGQLELLRLLERRVRRLIYDHPEVKGRVERLRSIPAIGEITALTWVLEIWDPHRFSNYRKAISYCGLCQAQKESAGIERRGPISKQRNAKVQWVLIEAAKMAVHRLRVPKLVKIFEETKARSNHNAATISVARELVKWLLAVDKRGTPFVWEA
jgi:transposase